MSLSPLLPGRVPLSLQSGRLTRYLNFSKESLQTLQDQLSSGRKYDLLSDAPGQTLQAVALQRTIQSQDALKQAHITNQGTFGATDSALGTVSTALNRARAIAQQGIGSSATAAEKRTLADEVGSLIQGTINSLNTNYNGRYLFAGTNGRTIPFALDGTGQVRYSGDDRAIEIFADADLLIAGNVDGGRSLGGLSAGLATDINPAITLGTRLSDLNGGRGVSEGLLDVTIQNGGSIKRTVDLRGAETLQDVKTRIEAAFQGSGQTISVNIASSNPFGLQITPGAGTVTVEDAPGSRTATSLGINSTAAAVINGADLQPRLSNSTPLSALNGGTGIGSTVGAGLRIVNGSQTTVVDLNGATTVGDVLNRITLADPDTAARISDDGTGIVVSTRLSGVDFSIGENGGTNAAGLGIRTLTAATRLADLNRGRGVDLTANGGDLQITRRDGTNTTAVNLTGAETVQDVINKINAADPGVLVASLNTTGNGISLTDSSGTGALSIAATNLSTQLGLDGTNNGGTAGVLAGRDVNPQSADGPLDTLVRLRAALQAGDNAEIKRLIPKIEQAADKVSALRGDVGSRQQLLDNIVNHIDDSAVELKKTLGGLIDTDTAEAITKVFAQQQALEAALQVASRSMNLSVLQFLQ